jgi:mono/diheme cytochrome c family protein
VTGQHASDLRLTVDCAAGMTHAIRRFVSLISAVLVMLGSTPVNGADYLAMSGQQLYTRFCASCHGLEGRGDGPVAQTFSREVPDLTLIARRHGGEFQRDWVERTIDGRHKIAAHGAYTMPVWGEDFSRTQIGSPDAERATETMIARLVDYLETLQRK